MRRFADEELSPWHRAFAQAAGADAIVHPVNDVGAVRWNTAFAYLDAARGRENLTIRADTLVDRVLFAGDRAVGVATSDGDVHADHVVLAAGAYGSPGILLRSDAAALRELPIGEGLTDHVGVGFGFEGTDRLQREAAEFERARPLYMAQVTIQARSAACARGRVRPLPLPGARPAGPEGYRGQRRRLRDEAVVARDRPPDLARPARAAGHRPRLPHRRARRRGPRRRRRGAAARWRRPRRCAPTRRARCAPGAEVDAERHVREAARGFFHPVGTCAIGAVVDGDGRVRGCEGLSVADASIMPSIPRANTNLSTIALAERLAERMLARQLTSRSSGHTTRSTRAKAPRCRRSGVSHAVCRHGLVGDAELRRRRAGERELAVVGVARRAVAQPGDVHVRAPAPRRGSRLDVGARRGDRRAQLEARAAPDLVEGEREADVAQPVGRGQAPDQRCGAEVVGLLGVGPLLGAGRDEPDVARRRGPVGEGGGEGDERPDARGVVVGAGRGRDGVGMRHRDDAGTARGCRGSPITSREAPLPGTAKRSKPTRSPAARKRARDALVRSALGGPPAGRGPALRQLLCERVGLAGRGRGRRGRRACGRRDAYCGNEGGEHRAQRMSAGAPQSCDVCALFRNGSGATVGGCPRPPATRVGFVGHIPDKPDTRPDVLVAPGRRRPARRPLPR